MSIRSIGVRGALLLMTVMTGCATSPVIVPELQMKNLVGQKLNAAIESLGSPSSGIQTSDGSRTYTWTVLKTVRSRLYTCQRSATVDTSDVIVSYSVNDCPPIMKNF